MHSLDDLRKLAKRLDGDDRTLVKATIAYIQKLTTRAEHAEMKIGKVLDVLHIQR